MKNTFATVIAIAFALSATVDTASGQERGLSLGQPSLQGQVEPQLAVPPQLETQPRLQVSPQPQTRVVGPGFQPPVAPPRSQFYFGMELQLVNGFQGKSLRIARVTFGSPAYQAGLEAGDEILTVNGRDFQYARDSFEAVSMLSQFVTASVPGPVPANGNIQACYTLRPTARPLAGMLVRNVRNGQRVFVNVYPQQRGIAGSAPVATASVGS